MYQILDYLGYCIFEAKTNAEAVDYLRDLGFSYSSKRDRFYIESENKELYKIKYIK